MVTGHLMEQNGYYQMVLNWKGKDGKRKRKSISTRLTVEDNKTKAEPMLLDVRQHFNPGNEPENADMLFADFIDKWIMLFFTSSCVTIAAISQLCKKRLA